MESSLQQSHIEDFKNASKEQIMQNYYLKQHQRSNLSEY